MRPSRCVLPRALAVIVVAGLLAAGPAFAQFYDPALRSLDLASDVARSPRLLGMGSLSISIPDRSQGLNLWDFAGSPLGAYGEDSTSTLEFRPGSGSASGAHVGTTGLEREQLAGRASGLGFESFHRDPAGSAWGAVGGVRSLRSDNLYDLDSEIRRTVSDPGIMPIMTGPFPYWGKGRLHYAVRLQLAHEEQQDERRRVVTNAGGQFVSLDGYKLDPPSVFAPTDYVVRRTGIGFAASYPAGKQATLALGYDLVGDRIAGKNAGVRSTAELRETRPFGIVQGTLVGKLGSSFEYALDDRHWGSSSREKWAFTISAGVGSVPLVGSGTMFERKEDGNAFKGSGRWTAGNLRFAGQYWTLMTRAEYTPPIAGDGSSFNTFLSQVYNRSGADTLGLPDSVLYNRDQVNAFGYSGGVSWKLKRGEAGIEYHWGREIHGETVAGVGPKSIAYDVRAGLEHRCSEIVALRYGAGLLWQDRDEFTHDNKWKGESASLGLGLTPPAASWGLDMGWTMTWLQPDFSDPLIHRSSDQQFQSLLHWRF